MRPTEARAPDFSLPDAAGKLRTLAEFLAKGPAVIYFYPRNNTPGCTKEACGFRDAFATFTEHGCSVVGISQDGLESHQRFAEKFRLPFVLLSDSDGKVGEAYGVKKMFGLLAGRQTFLVDRDGQIRHQVSGHLSVQRHVNEMLSALEGLAKPPAV